jgi:predicted  nucleic acid-binding Zn-ribbon protein
MNKEQQRHAERAAPVSKLIHLDRDTENTGRTRDINAKISMLETSLGELQSELGAINSSVDQGLERLGDSDLDLTSKVSETYKRLGEIDHSYQSLSTLSENIDSEVRKLTTEIEDVAVQSAANLENRESQLTGQHEALVERVNDLVSLSHETNMQLTQSIADNTTALRKLERELVEDIDALANSTNQRSENIEKELESSRARILQLQAVDDVLEKRAVMLETTTAGLTQKSRELHTSLELLDMRSDELSAMIDKLLEHNEKHASLISGLQNKSVEMAMSIKALAGTENRHFKITSGFLLLAMLALAGLYFYHQSEMSHDAIVTAERVEVVDQQLTGLQQHSRKSAVTLEQLEHGLVALNDRVDNEVRVLESKLQTLDDQAQSLDGRISTMSSFSRIGSDNIIHGPQWLAQQPAGNYAIQVATVSDRNDLYAIAKRYSRYLTDTLSYYTVATAQAPQYVLVSGGYGSEQGASGVVRRLPRYVNFQRPEIRRMAEIQKQL